MLRDLTGLFNTRLQLTSSVPRLLALQNGDCDDVERIRGSARVQPASALRVDSLILFSLTFWQILEKAAEIAKASDCFSMVSFSEIICTTVGFPLKYNVCRRHGWTISNKTCTLLLNLHLANQNSATVLCFSSPHTFYFL